MSVQMRTLYDAVKDNDEYEVTLRAGEKGLGNTVSWVHMVERKELATFLEGREVTFITGIAINSPEELMDLVRFNFENGASAIVINVGPYIPEITDEIVDFCNEKNLPLFEVPWKIYMANIMKTFCEIITISERTSTELSVAAQNAIFFPVQEDMYIPTFAKNDFQKEWSYCASIFEIQAEDSINIKQMKTYFKRRLDWLLPQRYQKFLTFQMKDQFVIIFVNEDYGEILECAETIMRDFYTFCKDKGDLYCGVGRNTKSIKCLFKSYRLAEKVLKLQKRRGKVGEVAAYKSMGTDRLLIAMDDEELMKEFYEETLQPLVEYDRDTGSEYIPFLKIFFEEGGNIQNTASRLFVHRNSVNYKIHKIEEILHCNLSNLNDKIEISMALKLMELL